MEIYSTDYSAPVTSITIGYEFYFQLMIVTRLKLYLRGFGTVITETADFPWISRRAEEARRHLNSICWKVAYSIQINISMINNINLEYMNVLAQHLFFIMEKVY